MYKRAYSIRKCGLYHSGLGLLLSGAMLLPGFGLAASDLENTTTGSESVNQNSVNETRDTTVTETNTSNTTNLATFNFRTGGNTVQENTTVGDFTTGSMRIDYTAQTQANDTPNVSANSASVVTEDISSANTRTGAGSENINQVTSSQSATLTKSQIANVVNEVTLVASTGDNLVARNTTVGDITTGDIDARVRFITRANTSVTPVTPVSPSPTPGGGGGSNPVGGGSPSTPSSSTTTTHPVTLTAILPTGMGGAQEVMPFSLTQSSRKFFPAGSTQTPYLLILALLGLWLISPSAIQRLRTSYSLISRSENKMK
ncbi:MAG TPA: hypothetical protein VGE59_01695 [Patescibacteria group bacterium]